MGRRLWGWGKQLNSRLTVYKNGSSQEHLDAELNENRPFPVCFRGRGGEHITEMLTHAIQFRGASEVKLRQTQAFSLGSSPTGRSLCQAWLGGYLSQVEAWS